MDNLPAHRAPQVDRLIESAGARVLRLPPYSLDFNPIEQAISKVKAVLKTLAHRSPGGLFEGITEALGSITPTALHYIAHGGYSLR